MAEQAENGTGKGRRWALWAGVAVIAIAAAGLAGYKHVLESGISDQIAQRGGKAGSVEADFLGRVHLRDVTLPLEDGNVRIAAVDGRPRIFFLNGTLEVSGLEAEMEMGKVSIPHASIEDANLDCDTLAAMFGGKDDLSPSKRVEGFAAKRVAVAEVTFSQVLGGTEQKTIYKDVVLEDIADGRLARYSASGATFGFEMAVPDGDDGIEKRRMSGSMGAMTGRDIDAAYMVRLYTEKAGPDDQEAKPVYGPFSVKDIVYSDGNASFRYDEVRSSGFSMRMPAEPFLETVEKLTAVTNPEALAPAERQAFVAQILSLVDMIGKGEMEMIGLKIDGPAKKGDREGGNIQFAIDRIAVQLDGWKLDGAMHGLSMGEGADYVKFSEASIKGFSWRPTMEALTKVAGLDDEQIETFPFTTLLPEFGTIRVAGVDVDLPNTKDYASEDGAESAGEEADAQAEEAPSMGSRPVAASAPERIRFALKNYELALNKPYNGIPTDIRIRYEDMSLPIPPEARDEAFTQLRQLGFEELVLSSNMEAAWDEANQNLVIKDISLSGKDMGSLSFAGLIGGFTKDFFSGDKAMTQVALFGLTAREASLTIEDKGLIAKGIKLHAEQNGMTEEDVRSTLAMMATATLQQFAAGQPKLQDVADVFARFVAKPGTFTLTLKSRAERGIGAFDFVAASQNPVLLLDKIDVEATAK